MQDQKGILYSASQILFLWWKDIWRHFQSHDGVRPVFEAFNAQAWVTKMLHTVYTSREDDWLLFVANCLSEHRMIAQLFNSSRGNTVI